MYLKEYEQYLGTGEKNSEGMDLKTFLEEYNPRLYDTPANTVDNLIFTYIEEKGKKQLSKLLLIKRGNHPSIGWWALPGGFVDYRENLDVAAARELEEETGLKNVKAIQLASYGDYDRDPRTRIITTAYVSLVKEGTLKAEAGDDASDAAWFEVKAEKTGERITTPQVKTEIYTLSFTSGSLELSAEVERTTDTTDILAKTEYKMTKNNLIAADHSAIILHAMDYIEERLNK